MGTLVAVANQKGGVGKTTTAINLAACLAISGRRCLLVDIDPQGNATSGLGVSARKQAGTKDLIVHGRALKECTVPAAISGLDVMPADVTLIEGEKELVRSAVAADRLGTALSQAREVYDYVFVDCPPSLGVLPLASLSFANSVLIPIQCEYFAMEGLAQMLTFVKMVRERENRSLRICGILLTMYESEEGFSREVAAEVQDHFPDTVYDTIVPRDMVLAEATSFSKPVVEYDARSRGAVAYAKLCLEVLKDEGQETGKRA
jgi:chromosome partitioning protein